MAPLDDAAGRFGFGLMNAIRAPGLCQSMPRTRRLIMSSRRFEPEPRVAGRAARFGATTVSQPAVDIVAPLALCTGRPSDRRRASSASPAVASSSEDAGGFVSVSYTHLTLPTILLV